MDNGEELSFEQDCDAGILTVNASGFSYGDNYVVRVAEVRQVRREKNPRNYSAFRLKPRVLHRLENSRCTHE